MATKRPFSVKTINSISSDIQNLQTGFSGAFFNISSSGSTHYFNIPIAGTGATGLVSTQSQTIAGSKTFNSDTIVSSSTVSTSTSTGALVITGGVGIGGTLNVALDINARSGNNIKVFNSTNTYSSGFKFTGTGQDYIYTLPPNFPNGTGTSVLSASSTGVMTWVGLTATGNGVTTITKSLSIISPVQDDNITVFYTDRNITITKFHAVVRGNTSPSVSYKVMYGSDRSAAGTTVVVAGNTVSSTTTGDSVTSLGSSTPSANNFIWTYLTAVGGTVEEFNLTIFYQ